MKKYFMILMVAVLGMTMTSCLTKTKATVDVTVTDIIGIPQEGTTVYMFTAENWDDYAVRVPGNASKTAITDAEGKVSFNIQGVYLNVLDGQATLYFAIFDKDGKTVEDYKGVTVKSGDKKTVELTTKSL